MPHELVDPSLLEELHGIGGAEFVSELITQFEIDAEERIAGLVAAAETLDRETIRSTAHALKGSSASVGAVKLKELSADLESGATTKTQEELKSLGVELRTAMDATMTIFNSMK